MHLRWLPVAFAVLFLGGGCLSISRFDKDARARVVLSQGNYQVVETHLQGYSTGMRVFLIGDSASYADAMHMLKVKAGLDGTSRALINITEDKTWSGFWPVLVYGTLTLTADVIEFTD